MAASSSIGAVSLIWSRFARCLEVRHRFAGEVEPHHEGIRVEDTRTLTARGAVDHDPGVAIDAAARTTRHADEQRRLRACGSEIAIGDKSALEAVGVASQARRPADPACKGDNALFKSRITH